MHINSCKLRCVSSTSLASRRSSLVKQSVVLVFAMMVHVMNQTYEMRYVSICKRACIGLRTCSVLLSTGSRTKCVQIGGHSSGPSVSPQQWHFHREIWHWALHKSQSGRAVCNLHHRIYREQLCFFLAIVNPKMITNRLTKEVVSYLSILLRVTIITHTSNADRIHPILGIGYFEPNNMLSLIKHR